MLLQMPVTIVIRIGENVHRFTMCKKIEDIYKFLDWAGKEAVGILFHLLFFIKIKTNWTTLKPPLKSNITSDEFFPSMNIRKLVLGH